MPATKTERVKLTMIEGRVGHNPRTRSVFSQVPGRDYWFDLPEAMAVVDAGQAEPADEDERAKLERYRDGETAVEDLAAEGGHADAESAAPVKAKGRKKSA